MILFLPQRTRLTHTCSQASTTTQLMSYIRLCKRSLHFLRKSPTSRYMCSQASTMTRLVHFIMYFIFVHFIMYFIFVLTGLIADTANVRCISLAQDLIFSLQKKPKFSAKEPKSNIHVLTGLHDDTTYVSSILPRKIFFPPPKTP